MGGCHVKWLSSAKLTTFPSPPRRYWNSCLRLCLVPLLVRILQNQNGCMQHDAVSRPIFYLVAPNGKQRSRRSYRILHHYCSVDWIATAATLRNENETQHSDALRLSVSVHCATDCLGRLVSEWPAPVVGRMKRHTLLHSLARSLVNNNIYDNLYSPDWTSDSVRNLTNINNEY